MSKVETKGFKRKRTNPKLKRGPIWTLLGYTFLSIPTHIVYSHPGPDKSETGLGIQRWDHVPNYRVFKSRRPGLVTRSVVVRFFIGTFQSVRQMCDNEYHIFKPWTSHELSFIRKFISWTEHMSKPWTSLEPFFYFISQSFSYHQSCFHQCFLFCIRSLPWFSAKSY